MCSNLIEFASWISTSLQKSRCVLGYQMKTRDVCEFDRIYVVGEGEGGVITEIDMCSGYEMKIRQVFEFGRFCMGASSQKWRCVLSTKREFETCSNLIETSWRGAVITEIGMCSGYQNRGS